MVPEIETITTTLMVIGVVDVDCPNCRKAIISEVSRNCFVYCSHCKASSRLNTKPVASHRAHKKVGNVWVRVVDGDVVEIVPQQRQRKPIAA